MGLLLAPFKTLKVALQVRQANNLKRANIFKTEHIHLKKKQGNIFIKLAGRWSGIGQSEHVSFFGGFKGGERLYSTDG